MLSKDVVEEFRLECQLRRLTGRTIKGYYNSTLLFLTYLERQEDITEIEEIRTQHIKLYIQYLLKKQLYTVFQPRESTYKCKVRRHHIKSPTLPTV